jgi:hypothetical protein
MYNPPMPGRRLSSTLDVRVTHEQREACTWWANQLGISVADLVRRRLPSAVPDRDELADLGPAIEDERAAIAEEAVAAAEESAAAVDAREHAS